jgi:hypothetical protein
MQTKLSNGQIKDVNVLDVTPENYILPQGEEMLVHYRIEQKQFDPKTGNRVSIPRIQKTGQKTFNQSLPNWNQQGYTIDIMHDPSQWLAENAQKVKEAEIAAAEARAEAEQKKFDDAVNAKVAEALGGDEVQAAIDKAVEKKLADILAKNKAAKAEAETKEAAETPKTTAKK